MNFRKRWRDEPEINLIPFIDVLLVVLIFLMLTTTYTKFTEMQLRLPVADTDAQREYPKEIVVSIGPDGQYMVNKQVVSGNSVDVLAKALSQMSTQMTGQISAQTSAEPPSQGASPQEVVLIINADANARHQAVIAVMESAKRAGISQITFATQPSGRSAASGVASPSAASPSASATAPSR
jgi:biopolymer transport protein ExbD